METISSRSETNLFKHNISIGPGTMKNNISGDNNLCIGFDSMNSNTTGDNNIGIGNNALNNNISGNNNITIGNNTLNNNISGNNNITIGNNSLTNNTNTEPQNQIAIGTNAICPSDNSIYIGSSSIPATYTNFILDIRMIPTFNDDIDASNNGVKLGGLYKYSKNGITHLCINSIDN